MSKPGLVGSIDKGGHVTQGSADEEERLEVKSVQALPPPLYVVQGSYSTARSYSCPLT